jgi:hypothetical protein
MPVARIERSEIRERRRCGKMLYSSPTPDFAVLNPGYRPEVDFQAVSIGPPPTQQIKALET